MLQKLYPRVELPNNSKAIIKPMNVNFNLRNTTNKNGKAQIYLVLTSCGQRKRISLQLFIKPEDWDKAKQRAKPKTPNSENINLILEKISDIKIHYRLSQMHLSLDRLEQEFRNKTPDYDFISFMKHHTENLVLRPNSYKKHLSEIKKLEEYKKFIP